MEGRNSGQKQDRNDRRDKGNACGPELYQSCGFKKEKNVFIQYLYHLK